MEEGKIKAASKVLDYWYVIEFLGQDSYETSTGAGDIKSRLRVYKNNLKNGKGEARKQLAVFIDLEEGAEPGPRIRKEALDCGMGTWGNITVYLGKIKRELCIEAIASCLGADLEDRVEKSYDDIVMASFQIDARGRYIKGSFSLSPILWALDSLIGTETKELSGLLSDSDYYSDMEYWECVFWKKEEMSETDQDSEEEEKTETPAFSAEALTREKLACIYRRIKEVYADNLAGKWQPEDQDMPESCGLSFQLFKDEKARESLAEDNYLGLSRGYFTRELKLLKRLVDEGKLDGGEGMQRDLIAYINTPLDESKPWERLDLLHGQQEDELEIWLQEVLNMGKASAAKWPSRFKPALMQQIAVNFATDEKKEGVFGKAGTIFSVNGPPGTGKTTLLKEIVANNVVEKARLLAEYEDPDDAFEKHRFLSGKKINGQYSKYISGWYSLKDDRINDYHILVTSCNNTAVENITKELPLESGVLGSLKPGKSDGQSMKEQLSQVESLFSVSKSQETEIVFKGKRNRERESQEIYFTGYAGELLQTEDAWGLVAAPLGKRSNIRSFYYNVLDPMHWDFYPDKNFKIRREEKYKEARESFKKQLDKVEELRRGLSLLGEAALGAKRAQKAYGLDREKYTGEIERARETAAELTQRGKECRESLAGLKQRCQAGEEEKEEAAGKAKQWKSQWEMKRQQATQARQNAFNAAASVSGWTKLFNKRKYQAASDLSQSYKEQAEELEKEAEKIKEELSLAEAELTQALENLRTVKDRITEEEALAEEIERQLREEEEKIKTKEEKIEESRKRAENLKNQWETWMKEFSSGEETHRGLILDGDFVKDFLSQDAQISTKAQVSNVWATEFYNREREKLLYEALRLTREFILNSRCCRDNFVTLSQYWGLAGDEEQKKVQFSREDKEAMAGALYQTLFLLVPVISSTFASVGSLFKDVKTPGVLGTLIVDEAGQAQPQMAVGALFRSRKAVIVGDPKQVEPVVTEDLELLKQAYQEPLYRYYQDKTLSVQKCADILNPVGTYLDNGTDMPDWVGCPLLVHRRCISPMYEISNEISYGGIMKQQTLPPGEEKERSFVYEKSQWIHVSGEENGRKDHFVKEQGRKVCEILEIAFQKNQYPNLYIISPFKSVVYGARRYIKDYCFKNPDSSVSQSPRRDEWLLDHIGTVHTFQGKEANEVIFLLGCDKSPGAKGAVGWVNSNIVNVAATRAKYRLYIIGDIRVWADNRFVNQAKEIMDTYALKEIDALERSDASQEEKEEGYKKASRLMPGLTSFPVEETKDSLGEKSYVVETEDFISHLKKAGFLERSLSEEQLKNFGFKSAEELNRLPEEVRRNLTYGIKLYYLLSPVYEAEPKLDASCCAIMFCKALEVEIKANFVPGLKKYFPSQTIPVSGRHTKLGEAPDKAWMLGTVQRLLRKNTADLAALFVSRGDKKLDEAWWNRFCARLSRCVDKRNQCCHSSYFGWRDLSELLYDAFREEAAGNEEKLGGIFFECSVGSGL